MVIFFATTTKKVKRYAGFCCCAECVSVCMKNYLVDYQDATVRLLDKKSLYSYQDYLLYKEIFHVQKAKDNNEKIR